MAKTFKTEAFVLRKRSLLGKDTLIALFTQEVGKINVIAKGIRTITSRRLPHTETGNLMKAVIYKKDQRFYLQETTLTSGFSEIKKNSEKLTNLYLFLFILDRLLPENQKEAEVFNLTKRFFIDLSQSAAANHQLLTNYFNKLLKILGYIQREKNWEDLSLFLIDLINEKIPSFDI